jgi:hypothetical protein
MTIVLDTPAQINMWVLLSRRHQIKLHLKGYPHPGLVKWCKANIEGCESARTVKDCVVPVEYAIAAGNGPQDFSFVNVHVMLNVDDVFYDQGIYPDMTTVETHAPFVQEYSAGNLELVFTMEDIRPPNGKTFLPA